MTCSFKLVALSAVLLMLAGCGASPIPQMADSTNSKGSEGAPPEEEPVSDEDETLVDEGNPPDDDSGSDSDGEFEDSAPEEEFVDEVPVDDVPVDDVPVDDSPTGDEPTDDVPTDDPPLEGDLVDDAPSDDAPSDDAPPEGDLVDEVPTDDTPSDDVPTDDAASDDVAGDGSGDGETPAFKEGTPEHALYSFVINLTSGKTDELAGLIASRATGDLKGLRGGTLSEEKLDQWKSRLGRVRLAAAPRSIQGGVFIALENADGERIQFTLSREGGKMVIREMKLGTTAVRPRGLNPVDE